jgi:hypothetical protein
MGQGPRLCRSDLDPTERSATDIPSPNATPVRARVSVPCQPRDSGARQSLVGL